MSAGSPDPGFGIMAASQRAEIGVAERRQLTVMLCDLVGSTALAERHDPEDFSEVVTSFLACCADVAKRFDGYIARYMGDGLLVYFGYPEASEHDAERAILAGLAIVSAVRALRPRWGLTLETRVGIATGEVVVGDLIGTGVSQEPPAVGRTAHVAARLQGLAEPNSVAVSDATYRLARGFFEWLDLGNILLKGFAEPVQAWRALRERQVASRFEASHTAADLWPLVDRRAERTLLSRWWSRVEASEGHVVQLSGEPGIGKSRLVVELVANLADKAFTTLRYYCSPYHQSSALYPIIKQLEGAARLLHDEPPEKKLDRIEDLLTRTGAAVDATAPLLASLLSLPIEPRYAPLNFTAQQLKFRTLEALEAWVVRLTTKQTTLMVFEDLHWADPTTLELLDRLVERVHDLPVLLLMTFRPDFASPWENRPHVKTLILQRLPQDDCMQLAKGIAGVSQVPSGVLDRIVAHADGVPLFLEELTKTVLQTSDLGGQREGTLQNVHVPETLQDALMARLDRLGRWKEVAQIGALIGPRFSFKMLTALVPSEEEAAVALQHLLAVGLIRSEGSPPEAVYTFRHALLQDVAVASLLRSRRESLHIRIARTLESEFPQTALAEPELLAWHYSSAGLVEPAVDWSLSAAKREMQRSANIEAIDHLRKGLELLKTLPDSPERDRRELDLQTHLGAALTAAKGFAAPEVRDAYVRARSLCAHLEDPSQVFPVLRGLWVYHLVRAEWRQAQDLSEQMLELSERKNDVGYQLEGHRALGMTLLWRGELRRAHERFELGYNAYNPEQHHRHAVVYGNDPGVACLAHGGYVLSVLGHLEQALAHGAKAVALARRQAHPFSVVQALIYCAFIHHTRREPQQVLKFAKESMRLAREHGFPFWLAEARMMDGWAQCEQGAACAGLAQLQQGFTEFLDTGALMDRPRWLSVLAEAHARCNQPDAGLRALTEGLIVVDETGERFYEARLLGLLGDILFLRGGLNAERDAETAYLKSLKVARQQGAKVWELRTATSLTRLWGLQGRAREGLDLLASLYGWFDEGFDTPDLVDAKVLLEGLR